MGDARFSTLAAMAAAAGLVFAAGAARADSTWNLYNSSTCTQIAGSGSTCIGDGSSRATTGNVYQFTATDGTTLTGTAYHTADVNGTTKLAADFLGFYSGSSYGLGVENKGAPQHAVDNSGGFDFVVFKFPATFSAISVTLSPFNTKEDMDATILFGTPKGALAGINDVSGFKSTTIAQLLDTSNGFTQHEFDGSATTSKKTDTLPTDTQGMYLIVAASLSSYGNPDYFKINALSGTAQPQPPGTSVPEPSTLAVLLVGAIGVYSSRRTRRRVA